MIRMKKLFRLIFEKIVYDGVYARLKNGGNANKLGFV